MMPADPSMPGYHLENGLTAFMADLTSHYYGGYYHVRIRVTVEVPLSPAFFDARCSCDDAMKRLGASITFCRTLEKMAVPDNELAVARQGLLDSFEANLLPYLSRPDFPCRFVRQEYARSLASPRKVHGAYHER